MHYAGKDTTLHRRRLGIKNADDMEQQRMQTT